MKGVVLAGGTGSRLYPLTKIVNKHLLPVYNAPMIFYPIQKLVDCGIEEILIISSAQGIGAFSALLGDGADFGASFTYKVQERAGGIAEALLLAKEFAKQQKLVVLLGDNIFQDSLVPHVEAFKEQAVGAKLLLKEVNDPTRFGIAEVHEGRIISIEEKPTQPKSPYCVTGIYMYDEQVFNFIEHISPSARGELEITDVNNRYITHNCLTFAVLEGWWTDAGTPDSLLLASILVKQDLQKGGE